MSCIEEDRERASEHGFAVTFVGCAREAQRRDDADVKWDIEKAIANRVSEVLVLQLSGGSERRYISPDNWARADTEGVGRRSRGPAMSTGASIMNGNADDSQAEPFVMVAHGGIASTEAMPQSKGGERMVGETGANETERSGAKTTSRKGTLLSPAELLLVRNAQNALQVLGSLSPIASPCGEEAKSSAVVSVLKLAGFKVVHAARILAGYPNAIKGSTKLDYDKKSIRLAALVSLESDETDEDSKWIAALNSYALQPQSFKAYRAALLWKMRSDLAGILRKQDLLQRRKDYGPQWQELIEQLKSLVLRHEKVESCTRYKAPLVVSGGKKPPGSSKRFDLTVIAKAFPDWKSKILEASRCARFEDLILIMARTGLRPEEAVLGVAVSRCSDGVIRATIKGAKVTDAAGQPWRSIPINSAGLPKAWLDAIDRGGQYLIRLESKSALRNYLGRLTKKVLPDVPAVTAYVFRHALASELRNEGASAEELARVLGHRVAGTQKAYGSRGRGSRKAKISESSAIDFSLVTVAEPVKPVDRTNLNGLISNKKGGLRHG